VSRCRRWRRRRRRLIIRRKRQKKKTCGSKGSYERSCSIYFCHINALKLGVKRRRKRRILTSVILLAVRC
jgi:hypothetical protein